MEARQQQPHLERILGQKINIEYKLGGGGSVAWAELVKSKPDGYVLSAVNIPHVILQPLRKDVGYKTEQLVPLAVFSRTPVALIVRNESRHKTLNDLIRTAKEDPSTITLGGSGPFTAYHFTMLLLEKLADVRLIYTPYTGSVPQMKALLDGTTDCAIVTSHDCMASKEKIRVLALATQERMPEFPNAPTFKELGFDIVESVDRGVAVPSGTPKEVVEILGAAFMQIARNTEAQDEMKKQGFMPFVMGPSEAKAFIDQRMAHYKAILAGIK